MDRPGHKTVLSLIRRALFGRARLELQPTIEYGMLTGTEARRGIFRALINLAFRRRAGGLIESCCRELHAGRRNDDGVGRWC